VAQFSSAEEGAKRGPASQRNTLQHTATRFNTLQHNGGDLSYTQGEDARGARRVLAEAAAVQHTVVAGLAPTPRVAGAVAGARGGRGGSAGNDSGGRALQNVAVASSQEEDLGEKRAVDARIFFEVPQPVCCRVLQGFAVCCSVLRCVVIFWRFSSPVYFVKILVIFFRIFCSNFCIHLHCQVDCWGASLLVDGGNGGSTHQTECV